MHIQAHSLITDPSCVWNPLVSGIIKINIDDLFSLGSNTGGIGGIFHDHEGAVLLHFGKQVFAHLVIHMEVLVIC